MCDLDVFNIYGTSYIVYFYAKVTSMKKSIFTLLAITTLASCNNKSAGDKAPITAHDSTTVEKIAHRAGYAGWNDVQEIAFTFNVSNAQGVARSREWTWNAKTGDVLMIAQTDTVRFNRKQALSKIQTEADKHFINDTYWLLPEFKFLTDKGTKITEKNNVAAPISGKTMNMITIAYSGDGGYTPGDAYDAYYNKNYEIQEWVFRKGNDTIPSLMTTFENRASHGGLNIVTNHNLPDRMSRIHFTNIKVKTN